jgi:hypothetical protein
MSRIKFTFIKSFCLLHSTRILQSPKCWPDGEEEVHSCLAEKIFLKSSGDNAREISCLRDGIQSVSVGESETLEGIVSMKVPSSISLNLFLSPSGLIPENKYGSERNGVASD